MIHGNKGIYLDNEEEQIPNLGGGESISDSSANLAK